MLYRKTGQSLLSLSCFRCISNRQFDHLDGRGAGRKAREEIEMDHRENVMVKYVYLGKLDAKEMTPGLEAEANSKCWGRQLNSSIINSNVHPQKRKGPIIRRASL